MVQRVRETIEVHGIVSLRRVRVLVQDEYKRGGAAEVLIRRCTEAGELSPDFKGQRCRFSKGAEY